MGGRIVLGWMVLGLLLAGCQAERPEAAAPVERPVVVATIFPLASLAQSLLGDGVEVVTLLPAGTDAHTFELGAAAARALARAQLVVRVGPGLDDWLSTLVPAGTPVFVAMDAVTEPLASAPDDHDHGVEGHNHPSEADPHVWLDPVLVRTEIVPALAAALRAAGVEVNEGREAGLDAELEALHSDLVARLADVTARRYIAAHPAFAYLNRRYGLEMVGSLEPAGGLEPSARWLADLAQTAKETGAACIFTEVQGQGQLGHTISRETGLPVRRLDLMGGSGMSGRGSYAALMRYDIEQFVLGLGGLGE